MVEPKQLTRLRRALVAGLTTTLVALLALGTSSGANAAPRPDDEEPVPDTSEPDAEFDTPLLDACPLDGHSTFEDSWGWARSGGRRHQGVDMMADRGVPVVAVRDGDALFKTTSLGGLSVWLTADNGDKFFYAHLDGFEGDGGDVATGDVIGYVGATGNAGGPHLHFETHPGGNVENPFPATFRACVPAGLDQALNGEPEPEPEPDPDPAISPINEIARASASATRITPS